MTNALTVYDQFDELERAAIALQESGYFSDVKSKAQAIVKVMAGAEVGIPPFASMTGIHIIQGKPVFGASVVATLVKNDPRYDYRIASVHESACALDWYERGEKVGTSDFTMEEAKKAGLVNKDNWKKYPSDMLFARAISRGARRFAPGIFGGSPVYTPDEVGADVDEDGSVIVDSVAIDVPDNEEVTESQPDPEPEPEPNGNSNGDIYQAVVDAKLSENVHSAKTTLTKYCKTGYSDPAMAVAWFHLYRGWRDQDKTVTQAASKANNGEAPE